MCSVVSCLEDIMKLPVSHEWVLTHSGACARSPNDRTVLQQHVDFFDRDNDGFIMPWDTYTGRQGSAPHAYLAVRPSCWPFRSPAVLADCRKDSSLGPLLKLCTRGIEFIFQSDSP